MREFNGRLYREFYNVDIVNDEFEAVEAKIGVRRRILKRQVARLTCV